MSTYCYTLRKGTKNVNIDGTFQAIPQFKFAYGNARGFWRSNETERVQQSQLAAAERAFCHYRDENGYVLALDGEWVVLTNRDSYLDGPAPDELHEVVIGKVVKVSGRLHCVAQATTVDLARNSVR